jgi:hypothetical protein
LTEYLAQEVVANYSAAGIPLDTMWTDIEYVSLLRARLRGLMATAI